MASNVVSIVPLPPYAKASNGGFLVKFPTDLSPQQKGTVKVLKVTFEDGTTQNMSMPEFQAIVASDHSKVNLGYIEKCYRIIQSPWISKSQKDVIRGLMVSINKLTDLGQELKAQGKYLIDATIETLEGLENCSF